MLQEEYTILEFQDNSEEIFDENPRPKIRKGRLALVLLACVGVIGSVGIGGYTFVQTIVYAQTKQPEAIKTTAAISSIDANVQNIQDVMEEAEKRKIAEENARKEEEKKKAEEEAKRLEEEKKQLELEAQQLAEAQAQASYVEPTSAWTGSVLTASAGVNMGPSGKETYYNLDMTGVISIMRGIGNNDAYWVREDGVKMLGDYVMVAANLQVHPRGSLVATSLGTGIVCDTGGFASGNPNQLDIAVAW